MGKTVIGKRTNQVRPCPMTFALPPLEQGEIRPPNFKLKARIRSRFGSQYNFAQALGTSQPVVSKVVNRYQDLPPGFKDLWAAVLRCKVKDIFD